MDKYICWGDDKENLTEKVKHEVEIPRLTFRVGVAADASSRITGKKSPKKNKRQVSVTCEKGHINIFDVE